MLFLVAILSVSQLVSPIFGAGCNVPDSTTTLEPEKSFLIQNSEYPLPYNTKKSCTWTIIAPYDYRLSISCPEIDLVQTGDCSTSRLTIGTKELCNEATYQLTDAGKQIKINFVSSAGVGKFKCQITSAIDLCNCGAIKTTATDKYPSLAVLKTPKNNAFQCGAVLVSERFALTSAACVAATSATVAQLIVGRHQAGETVSYAVEKLVADSLYSASRSDRNLGIAKTKLPILFSIHVGIACLPYIQSGYVYNSMSDEPVQSVGYGPNPSGTTPKSVFVPPIQMTTQEFSACKGGLGQICALPSPSKSACSLYDGYPLFILHPTLKRSIVLGLKTGYKTCGTATSFVNVLLNANLVWIETETDKIGFCQKYILPK